MDTVADGQRVVSHGTAWLQRHPGEARALLESGRIIRWVHETSGVHRGVLMPSRPEGCAEVMPVRWTVFFEKPGQAAEAIRDGAVFELRRAWGTVGYLCFWDEAALDGGRPQRYLTRDGAWGGVSREVAFEFRHPADSQAVRA